MRFQAFTKGLTTGKLIGLTVLVLSFLFIPSLSARADGNGLEFSGKAGYTIKGDEIQIRVEKLKNLRNSNSGPLRFTVWATKDSYKGGTIKGEILGKYEMKTLAAHYDRECVVTVKFAKPPKGDYRMVLTVDEYAGGSYKLADYVNFEKAISF